jgi:hypothetical protein
VEVALASLVVSATGAAVVVGVYLRRLGIGVLTAVVAGSFGLLYKVMLVEDGIMPYPGRSDLAGLAMFFLPTAAYVMPVLGAGALALMRARQPAHTALLGRRLLVLRVFGVDRNTESLFGLVVRRWPLLGPLVTIVDPSYATFVFARERQLILVPAGLMLVSGVLRLDLRLVLHGLLFGGLLYVSAVILLLAVRLWRLRTSTMHDIAALTPRLDLESRNLFRSRFPAIRLTCFDDLWKPTLEGLVGWADVVLMDLRGFDASRKGIEYEVAYLIDHWPLSRTVFLVDASTDEARFREAVGSAWATRSAGSPNAVPGEDEVHCYRFATSGRGARAHVLAVLALLGELLTSGLRAPVEAGNAESGKAGLEPASLAAKRVRQGTAVAALVCAAGIAVGTLSKRWEVAWLGVLGLLLALRLRGVLGRYGTFRKAFSGIAWPAAFWVTATVWSFQVGGVVPAELTFLVGAVLTLVANGMIRRDTSNQGPPSSAATIAPTVDAAESAGEGE